ncbi:MAG TPA: TRAP transporter substrate-binding protein [Paracoccaceae bacterium]|nr:TRAP transporter substrate-binding protein [Paracoccaceae bacterium]
MERRKFLSGAAVLGAGAAAGSLAAPAIAQGVRDMVIVSTWPRDLPGVGSSAQRLAGRITELSEGRIQTTYYAAGERVGAFDAFDEVASGNSHAYNGAEYYWKGKHAGLPFFTTVPFGMTYAERSAWLRFGDGQKLWDELSGEFGLKALPAGSTGCQMGGWFNREIESPEDLKGLKMRTVGIGGDVLAKLGVSVISLPGGQIYENLVSGAIDAVEWVGPWNDYFLKFYEAAKYYYHPGFHEPGGNISLGMNKAWWDGLTDWERAVITAAANEEHGLQMDETNYKNGLYLQKLIDEHGVELRSFNDEVFEAFGEASAGVVEEMRGHSDLASRIIDSWDKARREIGSYMAISDVAFSVLRNRALGVG